MGDKKKPKNFVLRIPDPDMMEAIEKWAADEIIWILDQALKRTGRVKRKADPPTFREES